MWLLQVMAVFSVVSGDAPYAYNAPNLSFGLPSSQTAMHRFVNNFQPHHINLSQDNQNSNKITSYSIPYKDYGYLRSGNMQTNLANFRQFVPNVNNLNIQRNKNNFIDAYSRVSSSPNAQNSMYHTEEATVNVETNTIARHSPLFINNKLNTGQGPTNQLPISDSRSYSNDHNSVVNLNTNSNYNNGHSLVSAHVNDLIAPQAGGLSNRLSQEPLATASFNNQYNQGPQNGAPLDNVHREDFHWYPLVNNAVSESTMSPSDANFNTGYKYSVTPSATSNNIYTQTFSSFSGTEYNDAYIQGLSSTSNNSNKNLVQGNLNVQSGIIDSDTFMTKAVTPIIHKHIYLHVPPPELDEPRKLTLQTLPPKKDYKILFIKVPSQTSNLNMARLQQKIAQSALVEEKTLIYVLVKKPEEPKPMLFPTAKKSQHQVFFVKYNGDPFDIASQVNDELDETGSIKSIVPLAPGLINGRI